MTIIRVYLHKREWCIVFTENELTKQNSRRYTKISKKKDLTISLECLSNNKSLRYGPVVKILRQSQHNHDV